MQDDEIGTLAMVLTMLTALTGLVGWGLLTQPQKTIAVLSILAVIISIIVAVLVTFVFWAWFLDEGIPKVKNQVEQWRANR